MRLNKKATLDSQSIPKTDKLFALNEAQIKLIKRKLNSNNIYGLGFDAFTKRYEDLQNLVVDFEELSLTKETTKGYPRYKASLASLTKEYMIPLEIYSSCTKGRCSKRIVTVGRVIKHGDVAVMFNNDNYKPSFEYQETFATISGDYLNIFTDGTFVVNSAYISYLRYPTKITVAGIPNIDGTPNTTTQDCELENYLQDELLDLAVLELAMETENQPQVQYADIRNKINE